MSRKVFTLRIDQDIQARLATLSRILSRPMNHLVTEALEKYLVRRSRDIERDLEASLKELRAYRKHDPDHEQAIDSFVDAEVSGEDPVEGGPLSEGGPIRREIDRLLNG